LKARKKVRLKNNMTARASRSFGPLCSTSSGENRSRKPMITEKIVRAISQARIIHDGRILDEKILRRKFIPEG
jgi:hypothetical protein